MKNWENLKVEYYNYNAFVNDQFWLGTLFNLQWYCNKYIDINIKVIVYVYNKSIVNKYTQQLHFTNL